MIVESTAIFIAIVAGAMGGAMYILYRNDDKKIDKLKEDKKQIVELLGRVYLDCDQYNGKIMNDTRRKLNEWVNG